MSHEHHCRCFFNATQPYRCVYTKPDALVGCGAAAPVGFHCASRSGGTLPQELATQCAWALPDMLPWGFFTV